MFFSGDLQSGIAIALQENKCVVCFVRDENDESNIWENEYLKAEELEEELSTKAVTLRLQAGSSEAGFLAAYFPLIGFPSLIIIKNGHLRGELRFGVNFDQFRQGLLEGLKDQEAYATSSTSSDTAPSSSLTHVSTSREAESGGSATTETDDRLPALGRVYHPVPASPPLDQPPTQSPPLQQLSSDAQASLVESRQRFEADRKQREAQALAEKRTEARAQQEVAAKASKDRASQLSHAQQQRKRRQEARQERERILKIIENDKLERRHQSQLKREFKQAETSENDTKAQTASEVVQGKMKAPSSSPAKECALRIRLLDGSSLRSSFPASQTLDTHVRAWIDTERTDGSAPYTFKQVLTPNNNHAIELSEEKESLQALGLAPNATLLMVRDKGASTAYSAQNAGEPLTRASAFASRIGAAVYAFLLSVCLMLTNALWTFLGMGTRPAPQQGAKRESRNRRTEKRAEDQAETTGVAISGNVRTLRERDERKDDRQFYNGNQLNFEPRKDEPGGNED